MKFKSLISALLSAVLTVGAVTTFVVSTPIEAQAKKTSHKKSKAKASSKKSSSKKSSSRSSKYSKKSRKTARRSRYSQSYSAPVSAYQGTVVPGREIVIDKPNLTLTVLDEGKPIAQYGVCCGENYGQKKRGGDHKTPEGQFLVSSIEDASGWTIRGKNGKIYRGCYGPWFFRLATPQSRHIGIHGTDEPESIGKRESEGCVRLRNEDLLKLKEYIFVGMKVTVLPDEQ